MNGNEDILAELFATNSFGINDFTYDFGPQTPDWLDEIAREAYYEAMYPKSQPSQLRSTLSRAIEWVNPFDRDAGLRFGPDKDNEEVNRLLYAFKTGMMDVPGALGQALQYFTSSLATKYPMIPETSESNTVQLIRSETRPLDERLESNPILSLLYDFGGKGSEWTRKKREDYPPLPPIDIEARKGEGRFGDWVPKMEQAVEDVVQNIPLMVALKGPAILVGFATQNPIVYSVINSSLEAAVEAGEMIDAIVSEGGSREEAFEASNKVYEKNVMLLTPLNILEGGLLLGGGNLTRGLSKMFTADQLSKMEPLIKAFHEYVKAHPHLVTLAKHAFGMLTQIGQEAFEEGMQYAFQRQALGDDRPLLEILNDPESWRAIRAGGLMGGILGLSGTVRSSVQQAVTQQQYKQMMEEVELQKKQAIEEMRAEKERLDRTDAEAIKKEASPFIEKKLRDRARQYVEQERESILAKVDEVDRADTIQAIDRLLDEGGLDDILFAFPELLDEARVGREGINPGEEVFIPDKNEAGRAIEERDGSLIYLTVNDDGTPAVRSVEINKVEPIGPGESVEWRDDKGNYRQGIVERRNLGSLLVMPTDIKTKQSVRIPNELVTARRDAGKRAGLPTSPRGEDALAEYEHRYPAPVRMQPVTPVQEPIEPQVETPAGISEPLGALQQVAEEPVVQTGALEEAVPEQTRTPAQQQAVPEQARTPIPNLQQEMKNNPAATRLFADLVRNRKAILNAKNEGKLDYNFIKDLLYGKGTHQTLRKIDEAAANDAVAKLASNPDEVVRLLEDTEFINTTYGNTGHFMTGYWGNKARVARDAYNGIFRKGYRPSRILDIFGGSGYVSNLLNRTLGQKQLPVVLNDANPDTFNTHRMVKEKTDDVINLLKKYQAQTKKMWDDTHGKKINLTEAERQFRAKYDSWWKDRRSEAQSTNDPVVKAVWQIISNDGSLAVGDDSQRVANVGKTTKKPFERLGELVKRVSDAAEQYNNGKYTISNRDALEVLQEAKPGDLVVIDPPYIAAPEMYNRGQDSPWLDEKFVAAFLRQRVAPLIEQGVDFIFHDNASPGLVNVLEEIGMEVRTFPRQSQNTNKDAKFVNEVVGFTTGLKQPAQKPVTSGQRAAAAMPTEKPSPIERPEGAYLEPTGQIPSVEQVRASEGPLRASEGELPVSAVEEGGPPPVRTEDVGAVKEKRSGAEWAKRYKDAVKLTNIDGWESIDDFTNTEITKEEFSNRLAKSGHEWTGKQSADETLMPVFVEDVKKISESKEQVAKKEEAVKPEAPVTEEPVETKERPEIKKVKERETFETETPEITTETEEAGIPVVDVETLVSDTSRPLFVPDKSKQNLRLNAPKAQSEQEYLRNGLIYSNHSDDMYIGNTPAGNPVLIARKSARASSNDYLNNTTSPSRPGLATTMFGEKGDQVYIFHSFEYKDGKYDIVSEYSTVTLGNDNVFRFSETNRSVAKFFAGDKNAQDFEQFEAQAKKLASMLNEQNARGELVLPSSLKKGVVNTTNSFSKKLSDAMKAIHKSLNMEGATELVISIDDISDFNGLIKYGGLTWNPGLIEFVTNARHAGGAFAPTINHVDPETGNVMSDPRVATIVLNATNDADIITNFGHEVGHHMFDIALRERILSPELLGKYIDSYRKYVSEAQASPDKGRKAFLESTYLAGTAELSGTRLVEDVAVGDNDSLVNYYINNQAGIHEHFANNVGRWVQTNQKPVTALERVYYDLAQRLKRIVAAVKNALRQLGISDRYGVDPTVEDIINSFKMRNIEMHYGDNQVTGPDTRGIRMIPRPDETGKYNLDVLKKYGLNRAMDTPTPEMQAEDRSMPPDVPEPDEDFDVRKSFRYGDEKAKDPRTTLQRFRGLAQNQYRLWMDQLDSLRRLQKMIEETDKTYAKDEWAVYDYARVVIGSMENAEQFVTRIHHLLRHVDANRADDFIGYLVAEHAIDFINPATGEFYPDSPVIYDANGNKMTPKDAIDYVDAHSAEFGDIAQAIRMHYNMAMYKTLVGSGIMNEQTFEKMRIMYPNYVPFFKDIDSSLLEHFIKGDVKKIIQIQKGVQELKGGDVQELLKNPLESMVKNIAVFHSLAARNKVHERLVNISNRKGFEWVASPIEKPSQAGKQPVFSMWKNGEKIYFTTDNDIYEALKVFQNEQSKNFNAVLELSERAVRLFKLGTTRWNPVFMIRNFLKDPFEVSRNTQFWSPPFYHTFKGLVYLIEDAVNVRRGGPGNKYVKRFREGGGFSSGLVERMAPKKIAKDIRAQFHKTPIQQSESLLNPRTWLEAIGALNQMIEMAPKIAEFQMLTESKRFRDMPEVRKIRLAREVNIDFGRAGLFGKTANRHIAFFNAAMQSVDKFVRAFNEGATPQERRQSFARATTKSILYVTLPSILLWMLNHRDPEIEKEYRELPQDMRDRYWVFKIGDTWFRAPKPFEYGMIFGTLAERWLDDVYTDDPDAWRLFARHASDSILPPFIPTLLGPWIEAGMNQDLFFDRPIIPASKINLPRHQQYGPGTTEFAKRFANSFIGRALDVSPYHVDHYISSYLGGVGSGTLSTLDIFAEMLGIRPSGPKKGIQELPFIRGFTIVPYRRSESVSRFYDYYDELEQGYMGAKVANERYEYEKLYKYFGKTRRKLSELWKEKNAIRENERLKPEVKRVRMDEIDNKAVIIATRALDDYYRIVKKEGNGR